MLDKDSCCTRVAHVIVFFFSSRRRHTRLQGDWSSDVCSSDLEGVDAGGVTLGFVFAVAAIVLFGWQAGVIVAAGGPTVTHLLGHRPPLRVAYNGSMFALSALAGGLAIQLIPEHSVGSLIVRVALCAFLYNWVVNLVLISAVLAASSGKPFFRLIWDNAKQTTAPFALMSSAALMLVVLWPRSPALSLALVGPLLP